MNTLLAYSRRAAIAAMFLALPLSAAAQDADASAQQGTRTQGPMVVQRVKSGFQVTPEVKITKFDSKTSEVVGADAGWLADKIFFIGGGGYWLANQSRDRKLAYGGLVLGLSTPVDAPVSFGVKTLIGGGRATVVRGFTFYNDDFRGRPNQPQFITENVRLSDSFPVVEPEANAAFRLGDHFRVVVGAGYRWIGRERGGLDRLGGATGTVGLQIGG